MIKILKGSLLSPAFSISVPFLFVLNCFFFSIHLTNLLSLLPIFTLHRFHRLVILTYLFVSVNERDWRYPCMTELYEHVLGYLIILSGCIITEACIAFISTRGTIMDNEPRASMQYLLYVRLGG